MEIILEEINKDIPMTRLLNGDVGSGKTVVAASAVLNTIKHGFSCILLAPTTVLAKQHYDTFKDLFKGFNIPIELCISSQQEISDANNKLIIATHSILYDKQLPPDLNLVIIDEQHRFGVEQRKYFVKKLPHTPHHLTMTATPIPRSLTEIFFGNMDVSEIKEKPSNRKEIKSFYRNGHFYAPSSRPRRAHPSTRDQPGAGVIARARMIGPNTSRACAAFMSSVT